MSDQTVEVHCDRHGKSYATFVCQHLAYGVGHGFFCSGDDPDDPRPDAWCTACDRVLEQEQGWNQRSEAFADIKLLCAHCYDEAKRRNEKRKRRRKLKGFTCATCGEYHPDLPMDFGWDAPIYYIQAPKSQRKKRFELSTDLCVMDGEHYFIRGCLEIPVRDGPRPFAWGVWTTLSRTNYERVQAKWDDPERVQEPPYFGWLSSRIPYYPATVNLKTHVHTRPLGDRPSVVLEPTDHPLAAEQREGITMERVLDLAEALLHDNGK